MVKVVSPIGVSIEVLICNCDVPVGVRVSVVKAAVVPAGTPVTFKEIPAESSFIEVIVIV
jgi:hypothetical protein